MILSLNLGLHYSLTVSELCNVVCCCHDLVCGTPFSVDFELLDLLREIAYRVVSLLVLLFVSVFAYLAFKAVDFPVHFV